jgi:predicted negative regulator of RcsB-dependent stress response
MKNIIVLIILATVAWIGYRDFKAGDHPASGAASAFAAEVASAGRADEAEADLPYTCDGRTRCTQMNSCAEATYFIQHCPNTQMDGNNDGVPCERQWCNR